MTGPTLMSVRKVYFPPELTAFIAAKIASGEYVDASDIARDGLRRMMREEAEQLEEPARG